MTEAEWEACDSPAELLAFLGSRVSERKLRLFGVLCCRQNWDLCTDNRLRWSIEVAEELADSSVAESDRSRAESLALDVLESRFDLDFGHDAFAVVCLIAKDRYDFQSATSCAEGASHLAQYADEGSFAGLGKEIANEQCVFIRDIFGNPFHPLAFSPEWRTSTTVALARQMYDARGFSLMPILADALQDAGCDSGDILGHCRGPGPHVRGCWVVDLVLGKG